MFGANFIQPMNPNQMLETMMMFAAAPSMMQMVTGQGETQVGMQEMTTTMVGAMKEKFVRGAQADEWEAKTRELHKIKEYLIEVGFEPDELKNKTYEDLAELAKP